MKLITEALQQRFAEIGDQSESKNPLFIAKFFDPCGSATWYATAYDSETNICEGYVTGLAFDEFGSFSITELESIERPFGLTIERDIHFKEKTYEQLLQTKAEHRTAELNKQASQSNAHNHDIER